MPEGPLPVNKKQQMSVERNDIAILSATGDCPEHSLMCPQDSPIPMQLPCALASGMHALHVLQRAQQHASAWRVHALQSAASDMVNMRTLPLHNAVICKGSEAFTKLDFARRFSVDADLFSTLCKLAFAVDMSISWATSCWSGLRQEDCWVLVWFSADVG